MAVLCAFRDSKQARQANTWSKYAVTAETIGQQLNIIQEVAM